MENILRLALKEQPILYEHFGSVTVENKTLVYWSVTARRKRFI